MTQDTVDCFRPPIEWALTSQETRVFGVLVNRDIATKPAIMEALYGDRAAAGDVADQKIVDVFICKIRKKLRPFGVSINTIWGQGYTLDPEVRQTYRLDHRRNAA